MEILHDWIEYNARFRIVKENGALRVEMKRPSGWIKTRNMSQKEFDLLYKETAKRGQWA